MGHFVVAGYLFLKRYNFVRKEIQKNAAILYPIQNTCQYSICNTRSVTNPCNTKVRQFVCRSVQTLRILCRFFSKQDKVYFDGKNTWIGGGVLDIFDPHFDSPIIRKESHEETTFHG